MNPIFRTGDGDPPENAGLFWRKIRSKDLPNDFLTHVEFAFLGLGDTNYTTFLGYPKSVEKQLLKLGAKQFYKSGWADDAVGLEIVVDPWIDDLWAALENQKSNPINLQTTLPDKSLKNTGDEVSKEEVPVISKAPEQPVPIDKQEEKLEKCVVELASLKLSVSPLSECDLKVPILPVPYLELKFNSKLMVSFFFTLLNKFTFLMRLVLSSSFRKMSCGNQCRLQGPRYFKHKLKA